MMLRALGPALVLAVLLGVSETHPEMMRDIE